MKLRRDKGEPGADPPPPQLDPGQPAYMFATPMWPRDVGMPSWDLGGVGSSGSTSATDDVTSAVPSIRRIVTFAASRRFGMVGLLGAPALRSHDAPSNVDESPAGGSLAGVPQP